MLSGSDSVQTQSIEHLSPLHADSKAMFGRQASVEELGTASDSSVGQIQHTSEPGQERLGPKDLLESFRWNYHLLVDLGPLGRELLGFWFRIGIFMKTQYTGMGCLEMALAAVAWSLRNEFGFSVPDFHQLEGCDILPKCREVHSKLGIAVGPQCLYDDILNRLPLDVRLEFQALEWPSKEWCAAHPDKVDDHVSALMHKAVGILNKLGVFDKAKSHCTVHERPCPIEDPAIITDEFRRGEVGLGECRGVRVNGGGLTCLDWSSYGDCAGFAGASAKPCIVWVEERRARKEPFWFAECTYSKELLAFIHRRLDPFYDVGHVVFGPSDMGDPVGRVRLWMSGCLKGAVKRLRPMSEVASLFRNIVGNSDMYYVLPEEYTDMTIQERADKRYIMAKPGQKLTYRDTLSQMEQVHLEGYEAARKDKIHAGKLDESDVFCCDLSQSPHGCARAYGNTMSTMTRTSFRWSHAKKRCLHGLEHLGSLAIPTKPVLDAAIQCSLPAGASHPAIWQAPRCLEQCSDHCIRALVGNGMHLKCAGVVLAWTFANTIPVASECVPKHLLKSMSRELQALLRGDGDVGDLCTAQDTEADSQQPFAIGCRLKRRRSG